MDWQWKLAWVIMWFAIVGAGAHVYCAARHPNMLTKGFPALLGRHPQNGYISPRERAPYLAWNLLAVVGYGVFIYGGVASALSWLGGYGTSLGIAAGLALCGPVWVFVYDAAFLAVDTRNKNRNFRNS
jgi:hypothetical protein